MPRTPPSLLHHAQSISPHLRPLLRATSGDLPSAQAELRWLKAHALSAITSTRRPPHPHASSPPAGWRTLLTHYCNQRARGKPLQYILGSQPFGELDVLCRPGVLIPRPESESITHHLASLLRNASRTHPTDGKKLKILDLCTGTGCIPLLLYAELFPHVEAGLEVKGVDVSPVALRFAQRNAVHNTRLGTLPSSAEQDVVFEKGDVLAGDAEGEWDVVTANPPYISPRGYDTETGRSVRNWEPRLALVPPSTAPRHGGGNEDERGDAFYGPIMRVAHGVNAKVVMMEVAGLEQAVRVARTVRAQRRWEGVEVWRDWPDLPSEHSSDGDEEVVDEFRVRGRGNGRAVVCWTHHGAALLGKRAMA